MKQEMKRKLEEEMAATNQQGAGAGMSFNARRAEGEGAQMHSARGDTAKAAIVQDPADPFALDQDGLYAHWDFSFAARQQDFDFVDDEVPQLVPDSDSDSESVSESESENEIEHDQDPYDAAKHAVMRPRTSPTSRQTVPGCDPNSMRTRKDDRGRGPGPTLQKSDVNSDAKDLLACMADELSVANNTATAEDYISDSARNALASGAASDAVLLDGGANCPITNNMMHCSNMRKVNRKITVGGNQQVAVTHLVTKRFFKAQLGGDLDFIDVHDTRLAPDFGLSILPEYVLEDEDCTITKRKDKASGKIICTATAPEGLTVLELERTPNKLYYLASGAKEVAYPARSYSTKSTLHYETWSSTIVIINIITIGDTITIYHLLTIAMNNDYNC